MTAPRLSCCQAQIMQRPSGASWSHSKFCKVSPFAHVVYADADEAWFYRHKLRRRDLDPTAERTQAIGVVAPGDECPAHPGNPRFDCPGCEALVDEARGK